LGEGFNAMAERIESLFADVTSQKENLLNTIGAVTEGLAVLDREGKIVLANVSFKTLSGEPAVEGRFFWEVMRRPKLRELIERVRAEKRGLSQECRLDDRSYLCNLGYLAFQDGIVLILHDLTELRKVEDIKRDFIVNASHELRTPLAAILGAAELLESEPRDGPPSEALPILKRNAQRLIGIVEDMLKLGELEDRGFKLDIRTVDAPSIASDILKIFEPRAKAKGLSLRLEAPSGIPLVALDPDLLERLLFNLIDNAVKYSDRGDISVRFRGEEGSLAIDVADTGPGIPPEHQARVFERFYVVDKSRSRRLGGTGLGLSIVKHIVQLHGGTIELRSTEGRGTTFTVRFPLRPAGSVQP
jgi:two-component system phosphate regulon sensor histidine kinase PhoR